MWKQLAPFLVLGLSFPLTAVAQGDPTGGYVGGSVGQFMYEEEGIISGVNYSFDESDFAYKAYGGYRFLPNLGVEVAYADLGAPEGNLDLNGSASALKAEVETTALMGYVVGYLFQDSNWDLFGKVGMASWDNDTTVTNTNTGASLSTSSSGTDLALGIGLQYRTDSNFAIRAEWENVQIDDDDSAISDQTADLVTVGANYRF